MKAPFPYFGGKSKVAAKVWAAMGQPDHYIEPFFGSGAVLLARPDWHAGLTETINDKDGFVANVWRSIQFSSEEVSRWCDWPVNHVDLMARKAELIRNETHLFENLIADPMWHDPVLAGYWIWAASCWIGSGLTRPGSIPLIGNKGQGVHKCQIPHIGHGGRGVHKSKANIFQWINELSTRLRRVRVVCGEWDRVCGGNWQDAAWPTVGVFFDPPYGVSDRAIVYHQDSVNIAKPVMEWARERGAMDNYRIVIAGYEEYKELLSEGWTSEAWKANGGYGNAANGQGKANKLRETLYFSPYCNHEPKHQQLDMWAGV